MLMNETESFVTTKKIRMSMNHIGMQVRKGTKQ